MTLLETGIWTDVCPEARLTPDRGVAAMVDGRQVAIFRLSTGEVHALDNHDPFSRANVLSRGLIGERSGAAYVASPVYKQRFWLGTGQCVDDPDRGVAVHEVRVVEGRVKVRRTA